MMDEYKYITRKYKSDHSYGIMVEITVVPN